MRHAALGLVVATGVIGAGLVSHAALQTPLDCMQADCEIRLSRVVSLSGDGGHSGLVVPVPIVVRDAVGRYLAKGTRRTAVVAFDNGGRFLRELDVPDASARGVALRQGPEGSVLAWTTPGNRAFAITRDLSFERWSAPLPFLPAFFRGDGTFIVAEQIRHADLIGYPLHLVSSNGEVLRSFGTDAPQYRADLRPLMEHVAAPAPDGSVWSSPKGRYALARWDPMSGDHRAVNVAAPWFVESHNYPMNAQTRPTPIVEALWVRDGLLWVLTRDADSEWEPYDGPARAWSRDLYDDLHDWILEVVDPQTARVVVSRRFESALWGRPPLPFVVSFASGADGRTVSLDVWTPELRQREVLR